MRPCGSSTHSKVPYVPRTCHSDEHETSKQNAHCSRLPGNPEVYCQLSPPWVPRLPPPRRDTRRGARLAGVCLPDDAVRRHLLLAHHRLDHYLWTCHHLWNQGLHRQWWSIHAAAALRRCRRLLLLLHFREFERLSTILNCSFVGMFLAGMFLAQRLARATPANRRRLPIDLVNTVRSENVLLRRPERLDRAPGVII